MLYCVQLMVSGKLDPPKIFTDPSAAKSTFLNLVQEHRAADFAAYCVDQKAPPEAFSTAKEFTDSLPGIEPCFYYWTLELAAEEGHAAQLPPESPERETILEAATETQQQVLGVQTELRNLTEKLTAMSQGLIQLQNLLGDKQDEAKSPNPTGDTAPSTGRQEELDEKYLTVEWQEFVQALIQMCGGNWGKFPLLSREDWRQAVYSGDTDLPYWEWVAITVDQSIARAKNSGYCIEEDAEQSGQFAYLAPSGERSSKLYELEDLAWCAAGLQVQREGCDRDG